MVVWCSYRLTKRPDRRDWKRWFAHLPEIVTASRQDDPVRREALPLHDEGDIAVLLTEHQRSQLLRQQVDVVDL